MPPAFLLGLSLLAAANSPPPDTLQTKVAALLDDRCSMCHDGSGEAGSVEALDLSSLPGSLVGQRASQRDVPLIAPGNPDGSYLLHKIVGGHNIQGDVMPPDEDPLSPEEVALVRDYIEGLTPSQAPAPTPATSSTTDQANDHTPTLAKKTRGSKAFHGTHQVVLPTTTTLGQRTLQFRIDHRFGRIGTERGAFGLDAGVIMRFAMAYGIFDSWDVFLGRTNARKGWELGTKYVPIRQESGKPVSFGGYASVDFYRDFSVSNPWSGNIMAMLSRLWFDRWSTMLTVSYHFVTNHNPRVSVDYSDGKGPVPVRDKRGTLLLGVASSVYLGKRKRWGIDLEYSLPVPDGRSPNVFYYRGGDADQSGTKIGSWGIGGSLLTGKHFFQLMLTNNRQIQLNQAAAGGDSGNPFSTAGVSSKNPFHKFNFFLGFNLGRTFKL